MSDYLNNLVARTLNLATVVQPRLPSLFESSVAEGFAPAIEFETVSDARSAPPPALPTFSADSASAPMGPLPGPPLSEATAASSDIPQPRPQVSRVGTAEKPKEEIIARPSPVIQKPRLSAAADTPIPTHTAPPSAKVSVRSLRQRAATETNSQTQEPPLRPLTENVRPLVATPPQPQRSLIKATALKEQNGGPVTSTRMVINQPAPAAEPPQTISVTIGRVDVRAVFPQPLAQRVGGTQKAAPMSLDEYLKRSEGRR